MRANTEESFEEYRERMQKLATRRKYDADGFFRKKLDKSEKDPCEGLLY